MLVLHFTLGLAGHFWSIHNRVDSTLLGATTVFPPIGPGRPRRCNFSPTAIPHAAYVFTANNLDKVTLFDVSDLDEPGIKQCNKWRVECNFFGTAFPFDSCPNCTRWITMSVDVDSEF